MNFQCPICNKEMRPSYSNTIWSCPDKRELVPEYNSMIPMTHATYIVDNLGKLQDATVIALPYKIHINYLQKKTQVYKIEKRPAIYSYKPSPQGRMIKTKDKAKSFVYNRILAIDGAVNIPWDNHHQLPDKIKNKIKLLLLFS